MSTQRQARLFEENENEGLAAWPVRERPLSRLYNVGTSNLGTVELLALIIGGHNQIKIAREIVKRFHDLPNTLTAELMQVHGVGKSVAARVVAALEMGKRMNQAAKNLTETLNSPRKVGRILMNYLGGLEQEAFAVLYLDTRMRMLDKEILYRGTLNTTMVRRSEVFRGAVRRNCAAVMVAHNHPSGEVSPSPEDLALTRKLLQAGRLLEIELVDHLVVSATRYHSIRELNGHAVDEKWGH